MQHPSQCSLPLLFDRQYIPLYSALVCINDKLYELDGRKKGPIYHGPTTQGALLKDACKVIQKFMARDPEEVRFTITALAPKQG
jgi:ubiquitin carboxyl-terminal hydrolase L3